MDDEILKMKHHKLLFELKFLYADLEYHQRIMNDATRTFQEEFLNASKELKLYEILFPEDNVPEPAQQDSGEVENEKIYELDKKNISKEVKFLHKKIVSMTHPDKLVKLSEQERSHRENIFLKATAAAEKDNLSHFSRLPWTLASNFLRLQKSNLRYSRKRQMESEGRLETWKKHLLGTGTTLSQKKNDKLSWLNT